MTTKDDLRRWFKEGLDNGATHFLVVVDTFDHEDYPFFVPPGKDVREAENEYNAKPMQRVIEVYSLSHDMEEQIQKFRNFNYDIKLPAIA